MRKIVAMVVTLTPQIALPVSLSCMLGTARCIKSQGVEIPSKQAVELLDRCEEFTFRDLGRIALKMSYEDINERASKGITPLVEAWYAFNDIYDSPLKFERKSKAEETNYMEIKRACGALERDFNDDSKWTE